MLFSRCWVIILLLACVASPAFSKSVEQAVSDNPWGTYQGDSGHTGYMPVSLDFSSGAGVTWDKGFYLGSLPSSSAITIWHDESLNSSSGRHFFEPALNQVSVVRGKLFASNRGQRMHHEFWIVDEEKQILENFYDYRFDAHLNFNDRTYWPATRLPPDSGGYVPPICPTSQSQPTIFNDSIFINTNAWQYESPHLCSGHGGTITRFAHLRQFPFIWTKLEDGHEASGGPIVDALMHPIEANEFDLFLPPTPYSSGPVGEQEHSIYSMGGGKAKERKVSGIYAFSADKDIATNLWAGNRDFTPVAANDLWTPAVNEDYVVAYTAIRHPDETSYTLPGGQLWVFDRETGAERFIVDDLDYIPEDSVRPFHMNRAPTLYGDYVVVVGHKQVKGSAKGRLLAVNLSNLNEDKGQNGFEFEVEKVTGVGFSGQVSISPNTADSTNGPIVYAVANGALQAFYLEQYGSSVKDSAGDPWVWAPVGEVIVPPMVITDTHAIVKTALASDLSNTVNVYAIDLTLTAMSSAARISHTFLDTSNGPLTGNVHISANFNRLYIARSEPGVQGRDSVTVQDFLTTGVKPNPDDLSTLSKSRVYIYHLELLQSVYTDVSLTMTDVRSSGSTIAENAAVPVGDRVQYEFDITNNSADIDATEVRLTTRLSSALKIEPDVLPVGCALGGDDNRSLVCDIGRIAKVTGTAEDHRTLIIDARVIGESGILLEMEADAAEVDWDFTNNAVTFGVDGAPGVESADITLDLDLSTRIAQHGDRVTFSYAVTNSGPGAATGVELVAVLPVEFQFISGNGCSVAEQVLQCDVIDSLENGASVENLSIVFEVSSANVTEAVSLELFSLVVKTSSLDRVDGNNVVPIKGFVIQPLVVEPDPVDLSITITGVANSLTVGQSETFTVQVGNAGPGQADDAVFVVVLPVNFQLDIPPDACAVSDNIIDCNVGLLVADATQSFDVSMTVLSVSNEFLTISAQVGSSSVDTDASNDISTSDSIATFARSVDGNGGSSGGSFPAWALGLLIASFLVRWKLGSHHDRTAKGYYARKRRVLKVL